MSPRAPPPEFPPPQLAVASNRAPVTFSRGPGGRPEPQRGAGGLVTALGDATRGRASVWVASALSDTDREIAAGGRAETDLDGSSVSMRLLALDPGEYDRYYNGFANRILWFQHHYLWSVAGPPTFAAAETAAWESFARVNAAFADGLAEEAPSGGVALPQDYHLALVPPTLRARRPDLRILHFWHVPFCQPDQFRVLPEAWGRAILEGLLAADLVGFQTRRWAENFVSCCRAVLGARGSVAARPGTVRHGGHVTRVGIYPVGVSPERLAAEAARPEAVDEAARIAGLAGDRILVLRADRAEPSKNILRGLGAYEWILERRPDLRGRVFHLALLTPSRRSMPEYRAYSKACLEAAARINERFGTADWEPVRIEIEDNFARTLAAYRRYDVLLVNPEFDGMNLIAREGPVLNRRHGTLVLSRNAGAAVELGAAAMLVNPFDLTETAAAIEAAIDLPVAERRGRARRLARRAPGTPPERWLDSQLADAPRAP
ncbi:MAG: trehalose-6-phosphate synthase [Acidobacteria bacterium]|nr:trehalose-6-phosphate synthase [Acidobacteriota bacterium]